MSGQGLPSVVGVVQGQLWLPQVRDFRLGAAFLKRGLVFCSIFEKECHFYYVKLTFDNKKRFLVPTTTLFTLLNARESKKKKRGGGFIAYLVC